MAKMKYWNGSAWVTLDANSADKVDGIDFRISNGSLQWSNNGGGTWNDVGGRIYTGNFTNTVTIPDSQTNFINVLTVNGKGKLVAASYRGESGSSKAEVEIIFDGQKFTGSDSSGGRIYSGFVYGYNYRGISVNMEFSNSLVINLRATSSIGSQVQVAWLYQLAQ